jgi:hypothetical protein
LIEARSHPEHSGHISDIVNIPIIQWFVEFLDAREHVGHCRHIASVPLVDVVIECLIVE